MNTRDVPEKAKDFLARRRYGRRCLEIGERYRGHVDPVEGRGGRAERAGFKVRQRNHRLSLFLAAHHVSPAAVASLQAMKESHRRSPASLACSCPIHAKRLRVMHRSRRRTMIGGGQLGRGMDA
jgi:hypothetical protein